MKNTMLRLTVGMISLLLLMSCTKNEAGETESHQSGGQVGAQGSQKVSFYAASRFAEQVSFGATPSLVAEIQSKGIEAWIDAQLAMPVTASSIPRELLNFTNQAGEQPAWLFRNDEFWDTALTAPDQLRQRVSWALFQYIPVSMGQANGSMEYYNVLRRNALGNYAKLLREVTINPHMGFYLNNELNRPTSSQCLGCTPNENYARELMQLFTVGVVQLNSDGSVIRDAQGKVKETYTQKDVEELARALTGWRVAANTTGLPDQSWPHYGQPMIPEAAAFLHDSGQKTVMGSTLASGMNASAELDAVVALLLKHPNIAPFEAEYARTLDLSVSESTLLTQVFLKAVTPKASFASDDLATRLRSLASVLPAFKSMGFKRQVFLINWGSFDTHYSQRGSESRTQDAQLSVLGKAVAAFDESVQAVGMDLDVTTFAMSDFGRTLRPASGAGSDHAWGNHWFVMGGAVAGGQVLGRFPSLVLGGPEDGDPGRGGRHVPTTSTDQVGASLMQWLGLPASQLTNVFPNLSNFTQKTLPLFKT